MKLLTNLTSVIGPHKDIPLIHTGTDLEQARQTVVLFHGRGASAEDILSVADALQLDGTAYLAPDARQGTWYPYPFLAPLEQNEPWLSSALSVAQQSLAYLSGQGFLQAQVALLGFSQGACLATEFAARTGGKFAGVFGLSGGLIGPPGFVRPSGPDMEGTPVFLGCSDRDPHIPAWRVIESEQTLLSQGAAVTMRLYPNWIHAINQDEIDFIRQVLTAPGA